MKFFTYPLILVLLPLVFGGYTVTDNLNIQQYLESLATRGYNKKLAPVTDQGSAVKVSVSAYILDIYKMDDSNMDFTADFYFRQRWNDSRLAFRDGNEVVLKDGITLRDVNSIWTPDLFFVEERQGLFHQIIHPNIYVKISPKGEVHFSIRLTVKFNCPMELHYYPHDIQECSINIESYAFQKKDINLSWQIGYYKPLTYSEDITMLDFDLIGAVPSEKEAVIMHSGTYSGLKMNLIFKRKIGYFAFRLYVPFVILALMTSMSFWIRADQRCLRLSFLLVILYLMVSISTTMNSVIPKTSYTKASDVWIGFCQSLVFAAFLEFIVVGVLSGRKSEDSSGNKGEIALTLDPEGKDQLSDSPKSPLTKVIHMFDARRGIQNDIVLRIDKICRIAFPTVFVIFLIIYCGVYLSA